MPIINRIAEFHGDMKTWRQHIMHARKGDGPTIGLRADMDALSVQKIHDHGYKSTKDGKMEASGHWRELFCQAGRDRATARLGRDQSAVTISRVSP